MEITLNIPRNNYKSPTEVRPEVVQAICNAFFSTSFGTYHPFHQPRTCSRWATRYVIQEPTHFFFSDKGTEYWTGAKTAIKFNGCEMRVAFKALREAGWHMMKYYHYGEWMGYYCSKTAPDPQRPEAKEVFDFTDVID